ncbi:hypothetical protein D920_00383, partial [Enterococcus faecalis 13-SD-W-01]
MSNDVYRLSTEDIERFLTNKEHLAIMTERVRNDFSCLNWLEYFIKNEEEQLRSEKKASQLTIHVLKDTFKRLTNKTELKRGEVFLRLETQQYGMRVYLDRNEWSGSFLAFEIYNKEEIGHICEMNESLSDGLARLDIDTKEPTVWDCYLLFSRFLTSETELVFLCAKDYALVVSEWILEDYIEDVDGAEEEFPESVVD